MAQRAEREPQDEEDLPPLSRETLGQWLDLFRQRLGGRAAGLWRATDSELAALGYSFDGEIDADVLAAFQKATERAALTQTQFGIVAAAANRTTVIATLASGPKGSQSWLGRLRSSFSCATPIFHDHQLVGALAVALPVDVEASPAQVAATQEAVEKIARQLADSPILR